MATAPTTNPTLLAWYNNKTASNVVPPSADGMINHVKNWNPAAPETVQGQLNTIERKDSPLMQQAAYAGTETAHDRGLLNSSVAASAAQDSVIKNALPIATADAEKYNRAAGYNVDEYNKANTFNAGNQFQTAERLGQQGFTTKERLGQQNFTTGERVGKQAYDFGVEQYKAKNSRDLQTEQYVSGIGNDLTKMVSQINQDPNMNQIAKDYAIQQAYESARTTITLLSNVGKIPNVATLLTPMAAVQKPAAGYYNSQDITAKQAAAQQAAAAASGGGGGGSIICTRCHQLGLMDDKTYLADQLYGELLAKGEPGFMRWYWHNASPVVALMHGKTWRSRLFITLIWQLVKPWSKQMAYEVGIARKGSLAGAALMAVGRLCHRVSGLCGVAYA